MSDFLTFLNSADIDTLTKTPGITRTLAESLIAARPFATADDCLNVRGMGPNLLSRMQSGFTTQEKEPPDPAHVASEEEAHPAPVTAGRAESDPNASKPEATGSRFGTVALNVLRAFLRFVALAIVLAGLVALVYYGAPYIRNNFIAPVEENTARIQALNDQIAALKEQSATLQAQLDETRGRVDALEQSIAAHTASLEKLAEAQSALETQMQGTDAQLRADMQAGDEALLRKLKRDVMLTRVIEYLSRARLYLSQSNFGLARADVQAARDLLAEAQSADPDYKPEAIKHTLARLDLALVNLPAFPVIAVGDVDIALEMLLSDLPDPAPTPTIMDTPTPVPTATPMTEATATLPPTPTPAVDVTPTPTIVP